MAYFVYILQCADDTFYIGSTNDLEKRVHAHNHEKTGARYTKARRPVKQVYFEEMESRGQALSREAELKKLSRAQKMTLIISK